MGPFSHVPSHIHAYVHADIYTCTPKQLQWSQFNCWIVYSGNLKLLGKHKTKTISKFKVALKMYQWTKHEIVIWMLYDMYTNTIQREIFEEENFCWSLASEYFTEKTFTECHTSHIHVHVGGCDRPKISWRKLSRMALKPQNLWKFLHWTFSTILYVVLYVVLMECNKLSLYVPIQCKVLPCTLGKLA